MKLNSNIHKGYKFMEIYLQDTFSIESPFVYYNTMARTFYRGKQMEQWCIQKYLPNYPSSLAVDSYIQNNIIEQNSYPTVDSLL